MAVDPDIQQKADDIRMKIYGEQVRESLASGLEAMSEDVVNIENRQDIVESQFQEVIENTTDKDVVSAPEIIAARNGEANLKARLDKENQEVTAQLAQTDEKTSDNQTDLLSKSYNVNRTSDLSTLFAQHTNVYFPPGEHSFEKQVIENKNSLIIDGKKDSIIKLLTKYSGSSSEGSIELTNIDYVHIKNITLEGLERETGNTELLIRFIDCGKVIIDNINVISSGGYGFYFKGCQSVTVTNNELGKASLWLMNNSSTFVDSNTFTNTVYDSIKASGDRIRITKNNFNGSNSDAIDMYTSGQYVIVKENVIDGAEENSIQMKTILRDPPYTEGSSDIDGYNRKVIVSENIIKNSPYAIMLKMDDFRATPSFPKESMPKHFKITHNIIENCDRGIYGRHIQFVDIQMNSVLNSSDTGIMVSESYYDIKVIENTVAQCDRGIMIVPSNSDNGLDSDFSHNRITDCANDGLTVRGRYSVVESNLITTCGKGLEVILSSAMTVSNNKIREIRNTNDNANGMYLSAGSECILSGNSVMDSDVGLFIKGGWGGSILVGNLATLNTLDFKHEITSQTDLKQSANSFTIEP